MPVGSTLRTTSTRAFSPVVSGPRNRAPASPGVRWALPSLPGKRASRLHERVEEVGVRRRISLRAPRGGEAVGGAPAIDCRGLRRRDNTDPLCGAEVIHLSRRTAAPKWISTATS
jgi:hypothetical protein